MIKKMIIKQPIFGLSKNLFRVLVFPSCNEPGLEIVRALAKSNKVEVWGGSSVDPEFDPSKNILKNHIRIPFLSDRGFKRKFTGILKKYQITHVFPTVDALVTEFAGWNIKGITFITPGARTARLVMSKRSTYKAMQGIVNVPEIYPDDKAVKLPAFAKPDQGAGGRGSFVIMDKPDLAKARKEGLLVCRKLDGDEYTVDCLNDLKGRLLLASPRLRGKVGRSISLGTKSVDDPEIINNIKKIVKSIKIKGPWFAQFKKDENGRLYLMEINCRMGGSSTLTRLSGVNIPLLSLFIYAGYPVKVPKLNKGVTINRTLVNYMEPKQLKWAIWDLDDTLVRKDGKPDPQSVAVLYDLANRGVSQILLSRKENLEKLVKKYRLPELFLEKITSKQKYKSISILIKKYNIEQNKCAVINDSIIENLGLTKKFKNMFILTPDALEVLGREKIK